MESENTQNNEGVNTTTNVEQNKHIEVWKIKRLINKLENTKGNGTSMVSLVIPPKEDINKIGKMLTGELSAA